MDYPFFSKGMDLLVDMVCVVDAEGRYVFVSAASEQLLGYMPNELVGRNMIELVYPEDRERTLQAAANVMRGQPHMHFENRYVRKDGRVVNIMWSARWSESDGVRLAVARDVTALRHAGLVQNALYRISEAAHAADGLVVLYQHVHGVIGELLPADSFCVALYDAASDMLSFPYFAGERAHAPEPQPLESAAAHVAQVIRFGQTVLATSGTAPASWLGVPLMSKQRVMGALVVQAYAGGTGYTDEDKELLQFVSTQVATAIERKQAEGRLRHMASHDVLTELPNRALFHDRLDMALNRARRDNEYLAVLYLDLNGFKHVNDTFGHATGDLLLRETARRLAQCVRESDTVGRFGGDEFTVLLIDICGPDSADATIEKIRAAVTAPFELDGRTLTISASVGAAIYPQDGGDGDELLRCADARMYGAKRGVV